MGIPDAVNAPLRVAIFSRSPDQHRVLTQLIEANGLHVLSEDAHSTDLPTTLDRDVADVLLVDLNDSDEWEAELLDQLIEQARLPVLFNDSAATRQPGTLSGKAWGRRLAGKLIELVHEQGANDPGVADVERHATMHVVDSETTGGEGRLAGAAGAQEAVVNNEVADLAEDLDTADLAERGADWQTAPATAADAGLPADAPGVTVEPESASVPVAERVWVLGASIGGPQAVKSFLAALPADLPIAFVLAQHIGVGFVQLLAAQLGRVTPLEVNCATNGTLLRHGQIAVAPVEKRMAFGRTGMVKLRPLTQRSIYNPSIDAVMLEVARHFGANSGAVVFSGMGSDGLAGCRAIREQGGTVWAQNSDSCVISSMADAVRNAGLATVTADPGELARRLVQHFERE